MRILRDKELEAQAVLELPDRVLPGAIFYISASSSIGLNTLQGLLDQTFVHWTGQVLNDNSVSISVQDPLTQGDIGAFCSEVTTDFAAQCQGQLT